MKKALKIGAIGMIGFMAFLWGGLSGYFWAWKELFNSGNHAGADGLFYIARHEFKSVPRWLIESGVTHYTKSKN